MFVQPTVALVESSSKDIENGVIAWVNIALPNSILEQQTDIV